MKSIKLLDCTLRDGGFVNNWKFGIGSIKSILSRLDKSGIDVIEVGFLDQRRSYDINCSMIPDTDSIKPMFDNIHIEHAMTVAMIDYGTCTIDKLADKSRSVIDGIRVIFKKKDYIEALNFCSEIKKKGYKIFVNPVSVTGYSDPELLEIINKINEIGPYGVAIVDTYGLMHKKELLHYFDMMDKNLSKGIVLGYHAHNNFQLAYANAIELMGMTSDRELLIDGSLYGMGKGAGNANTELLALYLNENFGNNYDIDQLLEAIDVDISKEYSKKYWGYSLMHYIAASNDCHPDYVNSLINKKTLSVKSINEILSKLDVQKKLSFNKELIESMYIQYHTGTIDDNDAYKKLGDELKGKKILVLAPGKTIESHRLEIDSFIKENNPVIISINFLSEVFRSDFVFMGNAKRYSQFFNEIYKNGSKIKTICTSNVEEANKKIDYTLNIKSLINEDTLIRDNPMLMLLNALIKMDIKEVSIAGFDGYSKNNESNYFREYIQFLYCNDDVVLRNDAVKKALAGMKGLIALNYLTPSNYL